MRARSHTTRVTIGAALTLVGAVTLTRCSSEPIEQPPTAHDVLTPVLSVRELMTHIFNPTANLIFDAAVVDVSTTGTTTTIPVSDEDWQTVERGLLTLAETSNLLKVPRKVAPDYAAEEPAEPGTPAPELTPAQIQAKIDEDRGRWNKHADDLRSVAIASMTLVKTRDPEVLFKVGGDIDNACEACHLEYWYPGDTPAVLRNRNSVVTPPSK
jgi:hypothetical protein